jgi:CheY-like chemotaxis protein
MLALSLPAALLVLARVAGLAWTAPGWSAPAFGMRLRLALVIALVAIILPLVGPTLTAPVNPGALALSCAVELAVGVGLGLAMVFGVAQRHGADIDIDSAVGVGSTVRLVFAAVPDCSAPAPQTGTLPAVSRRILIVDDDPVLLRSLHDALSVDGHRVIAANGGEDGINRFNAAQSSKDPFDVVFTDLGMPYVDGRQGAAAIKAKSPSTPVIMLTGWGQRMHDDGESPPNVDKLLGKPPRLRDLRAALASIPG